MKTANNTYPDIAAWRTPSGKWQCQSANSYKRYSVIRVDENLSCTCPDAELSARMIAMVSSKIGTDAIGTNKPTIQPPSVLPGRRFYAPSNKKPAVWEVYDRVKNENENIIRCRVVDGSPQDRTYIGQQFGYLIRQGIIRLI